MAFPYLQFYTGDWIRDTRFLTPEAKGCWMDTIAALHDSKIRGLLSHPVCGWARLWGVKESEALSILDQLSEVAEICEVDGKVCIVSRRIVREEVEREKERNRKRISRNQKPDDGYEERISAYMDVVPILSELCPDFVRFQSDPKPETINQKEKREMILAPGAISESSPLEEKPERKIPTEDECVQAAIACGSDSMKEFSASVGREFHGIYSSMQPSWVTRGGDDLAKGKSWYYKLKTKVEKESRDEISKQSTRREWSNKKSRQNDRGSTGGSKSSDDRISGGSVEVQDL